MHMKNRRTATHDSSRDALAGEVTVTPTVVQVSNSNKEGIDRQRLTVARTYLCVCPRGSRLGDDRSPSLPSRRCRKEPRERRSREATDAGAEYADNAGRTYTCCNSMCGRCGHPCNYQAPPQTLDHRCSRGIYSQACWGSLHVPTLKLITPSPRVSQGWPN
jgi:hypothetical protein